MQSGGRHAGQSFWGLWGGYWEVDMITCHFRKKNHLWNSEKWRKSKKLIPKDHKKFWMEGQSCPKLTFPSVICTKEHKRILHSQTAAFLRGTLFLLLWGEMLVTLIEMSEWRLPVVERNLKAYYSWLEISFHVKLNWFKHSNCKSLNNLTMLP